MGSLGLKSIIALALFFNLAYAAANVSFVSPTLANASVESANYIPVNVSSSYGGTQHSVFNDWDNSLLGWWAMDFYNASGAFDNSSYGTPNFAYFNNTAIIGSSKFEAGKYGLGINLTASNNTHRLLIANTSNFSLGNYSNAEYTIEAWFQPATAFADASPNGYYGGISQCNVKNWYSSYQPDVWLGWTSYSAGAWETGFRLSNTTLVSTTFVDTPLVVGEWYHMVATRDTTTMKIYKNGVVVKTYNIPAPYQNNVRQGLNAGFCIGTSIIDGSDYQWNGTIDEVRVYNRSLTNAEIQASYDAQVVQYERNFTSLTNGTYTSQAWAVTTDGTFNSTELRTWDVQHGAPNVSFVSPTPNNGSSTGNDWINISVSSTANSSQHSVYNDWNASLLFWLPFDFYNSTVVFDNSTYNRHASFAGSLLSSNNITEAVRGLGITLPGSNSQNLNTSVYNDGIALGGSGLTVTMWFLTNKTGTSGNPRVISKGINSTDYFILLVSNINRELRWGLGSGGSTYNRSQSTDLENDTWYHVAIVWNGTNSTIFINGVGASGSVSNSVNQIDVNTPIIIGTDVNNLNSFSGRLDEVMIYNRSLSIAEINASFNASAYQYYNNFTGLTVPDTYTSQAWAMDREGAINTTGLYTFTTVGNIAPAFQWQKFNFTNGSVYNLSQTIQFFANFTDDNGTQQVRMTFNNSNYTMAVWNGTDNTSATFNYNFTGLTAGTHYFNFTGWDGALGNLSQTFSIVIASNNVPNVSFVAPTPNNGTTQTSTNNSIYVNVSSSDLDSYPGHSTFVDWNYSLVGWWSFDFYNSTVVFDNSTYSKNLTFQGSGFNTNAIGPNGTRGSAVWFDGVNDRFNATGLDHWNLTSGMTVMFWFKGQADGGVNNRMFAKGWGNNDFVQAIQGSSGAVSIQLLAGGNYYTRSTSNSIISNNTLYHLAFVGNGTNSSIYINGVQRDNTGSSGVAIPKGYTDLVIGSSTASGTAMNGSYDEFMVFNRSLSEAEINATYNSTAYQYSNNFTGLSASSDYYFKAWAIDDVGNVNSTETRIVTINASNTPPQFWWATTNFTNSSAFVTPLTIQFFSNWSDDSAVSEVNLTFNSVNYTMVLWNGTTANGVWNYNISQLPAGTYYYNFTTTDGTLANSSDTYSLVIATANVNITEHLNGTFNNQTYAFGSTINASGYSNVSGLSLTLYSNGTGLAAGTNPESSNTTLTVGSYNYSTCFVGNENYSSACREFIATVVQNSLNLTLHLNGSFSDQSYVFGNTVNASGYSNVSAFVLRLLRNGTTIANSTTPTENNVSLAVGDYNYTLYWQGNENYSTTSQTWFANVSKGSINLTLHLNSSFSDFPYAFGSTANATGWSNVSDLVLRLLRNGTVVANSTMPQELNTTLSAGDWNYSVYFQGNQNYSTAIKTFFANISRNSVNITLHLNGSYSDQPYTYPNTVNATAWSNVSDLVLRLLENGTAIANATNPTSVNLSRAVGDYNFTAYWQGNENYSTASQTFFANISKGNVNLTMHLNGVNNNASFTTPTLINASAWRNTSDEGNLTLYQNGASVDFDVQYVTQNNQTSTTTETINYTACYPESTNYSAVCTTLYATTTIGGQGGGGGGGGSGGDVYTGPSSGTAGGVPYKPTPTPSPKPELPEFESRQINPALNVSGIFGQQSNFIKKN